MTPPLPSALPPSAPPRRRLANRRLYQTEEIEAAGGLRITATVGFDEAGWPPELFLSGGTDGAGAKAGSALSAILEDACVVISVALQYGVPASALAHSVSPGAVSPIGAALDLLRRLEAGELTIN